MLAPSYGYHAPRGVPHSLRNTLLSVPPPARNSCHIYVPRLKKRLNIDELEHRTPDRKVWVRCTMPPNTLREHTVYVLFISVGLKVLWAVAAESTSAGAGEYFPPQVPCLN
ncbi:hypothetical protein TNCV_2989531 [Trichonephila clavipes]|nr:hypothetical protein TNCV_2989531 [Trichonephila clavipes]